MREDYISEYWNENKTRHAIISKDEYHYIVRMQAKYYGVMREYRTELLEGKNEMYAEDCAENFVMAIGSFKDLDWEGR